MKHLIRFGYFILVLFHFVAPVEVWSQSGECWTWLNPLPQGNQLNDVFFVDAQTGWAAGSAGTILKTTDGGETWLAQNAGTNYDLQQVRFIDLQHGWMRDYGNLYTTTNGGNSWIPVPNPPGQIGYFYFTNPSEGFVVLANINTVYKTTDGGVNWVKVNAGGELSSFFNNIYFFLNAQTGWGINTDGGIVKTTDGGTTWSVQNAGNLRNLSAINFADEQNGWIIAGSNSDTLLRTTNGGQTWVPKKITGYSQLGGIFFSDPLTGWMYSNSGGIIKSVDGGQNWSFQYSTSAYLTKFYAVNAQKAISVGGSGQILATSNGGQSWTPKSTGFTDDLLDVHFVNNQTGWVVSNNGKIYNTANGGTAWTKQYDNSNIFLTDAFFSDTQTGWAVGSGGVVMKTINGGQNWTQKVIGGGVGLFSVHFVNNQTGWTVGDNGKIYKTTDGGQNWTLQNSTVSASLYDVFFINSQTGWIAGSGGTVLKTTNGGTTWSAKTIGNYDLSNIFFVDALHGWTGSLFKTSDGGNTWTSNIVNGLTGSYSLDCIFFVDASRGWFGNSIGNAGGGICSTEDGGFSGNYQSNADVIQSIYFLNAQTGWAVGSGGSILKYSGPSVPSCIPSIFLDGKTNVSVNTTIDWPYPGGCPQYTTIDIGTSPGSSDIQSEILWSNTTSFKPTYSLPPGDTVYVTLTSSNGTGTSTGCPVFSFVTADESVKDTVAPCIEWQNTIGGIDEDNLFSVKQTSDGGYILAGNSFSDISGDKTENSRGDVDYWVLKTNATGAIQWQKTIGGNSSDYLFSVQQTADGGYILGGWSASSISGDKTQNSKGGPDYWVVKINVDGAIQWQKTIGGNGYDNLFSLQQTTDGGYILIGWSNSDISGDKTENSKGGYDYWVVKLNDSGVIQWQKTIGGSADDTSESIQQTADGGYILGGSSSSNISGNKTENGKGQNDYWVVKLNASGSIQWQKDIGGNGDDNLFSLQETTDGGYILGGWSYSNISGDKTENSKGGADYWVVKLNAGGTIQWQKTIGGSADDFPGKTGCIQQTVDGGYILGGYSSSNISGNKTENSKGLDDYWIVKLNASGGIQWQKTIGGTSYDILTFVQQTADMGYILGGRSYSNISGDKKENSQGITDYWVIKLSGDRTIPSCIPSIPLNQQTSVPDTTKITWPPATGCTDAYHLSLGTSPGGSELLNSQTVTDTFYQPAQPLPGGKTIYVRITPYNGTGNASGCTEFSFTTKADCPTDSSTLAALYTATGGPTWTKRNNWLVANQPIAAWYGVHTDPAGCVDTLLLDGNNLKNSLPPALGDLAGLQRLVLSNNNLSGAIPPELGRLSALGELNLSRNPQLSGPIPDSLQRLTNLEGLYLNQTALSGPLPDWLGDLTQLRIANLSVLPNLGGTIPASLGNLSALQKLYLNNDNLTGSLPPGFANLKNLEVLNVSVNRLSQLMPALSGMSGLDSLFVNQNRLTFEDFRPQMPFLNTLAGFLYTAQDSVYADTTITRNAGQPLTVDLGFDATVVDNAYAWFKNGLPDTTITGSNKLIFNSLHTSDAGTYYVRVTNPGAPGLTLFSRAIHLQVNCASVPTPQISGPVLLCSNASILGAPGNFSAWQWSTGQNNTDSISVNTQGTYTVTVSDTNGCTGTDSQVVSGTATAPTPAISGPTALCAGSATLVAAGNFTNWQWSTGQNGPGNSITVSNQGTFTVTVTDPNGCTGTDTQVLSGSATPPTPVITGPPVLCSNSSILAALGNYTDWKWSNGQTATDSITVNAQNTYTVTVTDANGCTGTDSHVVSGSAAAPAPLITGPSVLCSGSATLTAAGTFSNWLWSNGQSGPGNSITVSNQGTYTVTVSDANGCTGTDSQVVNGSTTAPTPAITGPGTLCSGSVTLTAAGNYSNWQWSTGQNGPANSITVSNQGTYTVTVTDTNGCTGTASQVVNGSATAPTPVITGPGVLCSNSSILAALGNYTAWQWSNGQTGTDSITVSAQGTYTVTVTDANGCTGTDSQVLSGTATAPTPVISGAGLVCSGSTTLTAAGNFTNWQWSNGQNGAGNSITVSNQGTYTVTVTDTKGCTGTDTHLVTGTATAPMPVISGPTALCSGPIVLSAPGAYANWYWSTGQSGGQDHITVTNPGAYTVLVTDANGCTGTDTVVVSSQPGPTASVSATQAGCGLANGKIQLTAQGGTPGYTFQWSNNSSAEDLLNIPAGTYTVTVTDAAHCTATASAAVLNPNGPTASASAKTAGCGLANGSINLTVQGGTPDYSYIWSCSTNAEDPQNLTAGTYTVTVVDAANCVVVASAVVSNPNAPTASALATPAGCGLSNGSIDLTVQGGSPDYTFLWSNGAQEEDPVNLAAGAYTVTVTDAANCATTISTAVLNPNGPSASAVATKAGCGLSNGSIQLTAQGGTPGYSFQWSTGSSAQNQPKLVAGAYTVTVTDAANCSVSASAVVTNPDAPTASAIATKAGCGLSNGSIQLGVQGGTPGYSILWSTGSMLEDQQNLAAGIYTVTVTDAANCAVIIPVTVPHPSIPALALIPKPASCGLANGSIQSVVKGGTPLYQYHWSNNSGLPDQMNLAAGSYTVTVTDAANCSATAEASVANPGAPTLSTTVNPATCGLPNGGINLTVQGGTPLYQYKWSNAATNKDLVGLLAGPYAVTVTDADGCATTTMVSVPGPARLDTLGFQANCLPNDTFYLVTLTLSGGTPPYSLTSGSGTISGDQFTSPFIHGGQPYNFIFTDKNLCGPLAVSGSQDCSCRYLANIDTTLCAGQVLQIGHLGYSVAGNYADTLKHANGCDTLVLLHLNVVDPRVQITGNDFVCIGDFTLLNAEPQNCANCVFQWSLPGAQGQLLEIKPQQTATYTVTVTDQFQCSATDAIDVTVQDSIIVPIHAQVCPGVIYQVCDQSFDTPGDYRIVCQSQATGCDSTVLLRLDVVADLHVVAEIDSFFLKSGLDEESFQVTKNDQLIANSGWVLTILNNGKTKYDNDVTAVQDSFARFHLRNPDFYGIDSFLYEICSLACPDSCDEASVAVTVQNEIPNAFTPNGDGINERFDPLRWYLIQNDPPITPKSAKLVIWNRWGEIVYEGDQYPEGGWDGKSGSGKLLPQATYYFMLTIEWPDSVTVRKGAVLLLGDR